MSELNSNKLPFIDQPIKGVALYILLTAALLTAAALAIKNLIYMNSKGIEITGTILEKQTDNLGRFKAYLVEGASRVYRVDLGTQKVGSRVTFIIDPRDDKNVLVLEKKASFWAFTRQNNWDIFLVILFVLSLFCLYGIKYYYALTIQPDDQRLK